MDAHLNQRTSRAFIKQLNFLVRDLRHPGLHAKKFDETEDRWQGRVNQDWRFYFKIEGNTYRILDITPHPNKKPKPPL